MEHGGTTGDNNNNNNIISTRSMADRRLLLLLALARCHSDGIRCSAFGVTDDHICRQGRLPPPLLVITQFPLTSTYGAIEGLLLLLVDK